MFLDVTLRQSNMPICAVTNMQFDDYLSNSTSHGKWHLNDYGIGYDYY